MEEALDAVPWIRHLGVEARPGLGVAQPGEEGVPTAALRPGRNRRVQGRGRGDVGVLVRRNVEPRGARRVDAGEDARHPSPVVAPRHLEMRDLRRDVGLPGDAEQLVQCRIDPCPLVPHVARVDPAVAARDLGERDDFVRRRVARRCVLECGPDPEGALLHQGVHEGGHVRQLARCQRRAGAG